MKTLPEDTEKTLPCLTSEADRRNYWSKNISVSYITASVRHHLASSTWSQSKIAGALSFFPIIMPIFSHSQIGVEQTPDPDMQVIGAQNPTRDARPDFVPRSWNTSRLFIPYYLSVFCMSTSFLSARVLKIAARSIAWLAFVIFPQTEMETVKKFVNPPWVNLTGPGPDFSSHTRYPTRDGFFLFVPPLLTDHSNPIPWLSKHINHLNCVKSLLRRSAVHSWMLTQISLHQKFIPFVYTQSLDYKWAAYYPSQPGIGLLSHWSHLSID